MLINLSLFKRNRNFTLLFIGQFVSLFGTMITAVALPYQIYMETRSTFMVGLLSLVQLLPLLVTALIGGVFADRYHRRQLLLIAETILAIGGFLLAANAYLTTPHLSVLFIVSACMSAFNGLHRPALDSMVQQIVPREDFPTVASLAMFKGSVCMIAGPAIGGLLIATFGVMVTYLIDCITFLISLTALLLMTHIPKPPSTQDASTLAALKAGIKYAFSRQELLGSYLVDFLAMIFGMPTALFPAIALSFGGSAKTLGMLYTAPAIGAFLISISSGWTQNVTRHGAAIAASAFFWGLAIILFGLSTNLWIALIFLVFSGVFDGLSGIFRSIMWNQTIPNHLRGRMSGIEMISYLSGPKLGDTEAGLVAAVFGVTFAIVSGGALCMISVIGCCIFLPKFWRYRSSC